jgi:hypothetical protein
LLTVSRQRANELLADRRQPRINHMTRHTLRRTFASVLTHVGKYQGDVVAANILGSRERRATRRFRG